MGCRLDKKKSDFTGEGESGTEDKSIGVRWLSGLREKKWCDEWQTENMIHFVTDYNTENFIEVFPFLSDEIPPEAKVKCQNKVEWLCLRLMRNGEWVEEAKE